MLSKPCFGPHVLQQKHSYVCHLLYNVISPENDDDTIWDAIIPLSVINCD